jgi:hypothetical protein
MKSIDAGNYVHDIGKKLRAQGFQTFINSYDSKFYYPPESCLPPAAQPY